MPDAHESKTEEKLVRATILSLHRHGLSDTTVATITEIAGLSRGMVRHCFASKNAMMVAAYEQLLAEWTSNFFAERSESHLDNILLMVDGLFDPRNFNELYLSAWMAFLEASLHHEEIRRITIKEYDTWRLAIRDEIDAYAAETGKSLDSEQISNSLLALSDGLWVRHALEPDRVSKEYARRQGQELMRKMLMIE